MPIPKRGKRGPETHNNSISSAHPSYTSSVPPNSYSASADSSDLLHFPLPLPLLLLRPHHHRTNSSVVAAGYYIRDRADYRRICCRCRRRRARCRARGRVGVPCRCACRFRANYWVCRRSCGTGGSGIRRVRAGLLRVRRGACLRMRVGAVGEALEIRHGLEERRRCWCTHRLGKHRARTCMSLVRWGFRKGTV
jgi:hypothetical protein